MNKTGGRILVVDDDPPLLRVVSTYLRRLGFETLAAPGSEAAWKEFSVAPDQFAAAVLDATMPGTRVEDLAIKMMTANLKLCVIVASGYPMDMSVLQAHSPGRITFLHKPFTPEMLASTIRRMLATQEEGI